MCNITLMLDKKPSKLPQHNISWVEKVESKEFIAEQIFCFEYNVTKNITFEVFMQTKGHVFEGVFV